MIVVSDTSVITSLMQVGCVRLLRDLHGEVLIPPAVSAELLRSHRELPSFLEVRPVANRTRVANLVVELDEGEAEAIVLAGEVKADLLLIDEKLGRQVALREGLRITGLVGLVVEAKQRGLITSVHELLGQLETEAGFRVSNAVKTEAFRLAGE
ncbi:MAG: DUF3368 domain-containing protein [Limisphaerales bacterium]